MEFEQGLLIRTRGRQYPVRFVAHRNGPDGEPFFFQLYGAPDSLEVAEIVTLCCKAYRRFVCEILDQTNLCAVIAAL
jgi:hypothetical protein